MRLKKGSVLEAFLEHMAICEMNASNRLSRLGADEEVKYQDKNSDELKGFRYRTERRKKCSESL